MIDYQIGDRVRVTTVVEGVVIEATRSNLYLNPPVFISLNPDGSVCGQNTTLEVIERATQPEPMKVGTVIRTQNGIVAKKVATDAARPWMHMGATGYWTWHEILDGDSFTVIWEPDAEPSNPQPSSESVSCNCAHHLGSMCHASECPCRCHEELGCGGQ